MCIKGCHGLLSLVFIQRKGKIYNKKTYSEHLCDEKETSDFCLMNQHGDNVAGN